MGISGLLTFMDRQELTESFCLENLGEKYRKENGRRPTLLFDISSCLELLYAGKSFQISGEVKKFKETCEEFLNRFYNAGIALFIVADGLKPEQKLKPWIRRNDEILSRSQRAYKTQNLEFAADCRSFLYPIAIEVFSSSEKCKFHREIYEADDYIAHYLKTYGCFGVVTKDSDFILMEGSQYCFYMTRSDFQNMTATNYDRNKLARYLDIDVKQLPLWGSLCANDALDYQDLKTFYWKNKIKFHNKFNLVAEAVKSYPPGEKFLEKLPSYKHKLHFNDHQMAKLRAKLETLFGIKRRVRLDSSGGKTWCDILRLAAKIHAGGSTEKQLLEVLLEKVVYCGVRQENVFMINPDEELQSLRRKIYGFLFFEYPGEVAVTEHLYALSVTTLKAEYCCRKVTFTKSEHISLLKLWSSDPTDSGIQQQKLKYFYRMINEKLDPSLFLDIEEQLVFPLLAVFYLDCVKIFQPFELDSLLIHSILANKLDADQVAHFDYEPVFDALNLSSWFLKVVCHLEFMNTVCGNPFCRKQTNIVNYFEGIILHGVYREMKLDRDAKKYKTGEVEGVFGRLKDVLGKMKKRCGIV